MDLKRRAVAQIADELRPAVVELEGLATEITQRKTQWTEAWIAVLASEGALSVETHQLLELVRV